MSEDEYDSGEENYLPSYGFNTGSELDEMNIGDEEYIIFDKGNHKAWLQSNISLDSELMEDDEKLDKVLEQIT